MSVITTAVNRFRATLLLLFLIILAGIVSRSNMVIEAFPNPSLPLVMVQLMQDGVSPEDGARLLVRPMEAQLRSIDGLKEIRSVSRETLSYVIVEFESDKNVSQALMDVRAAVDRAKSELPQSAEEPIVEEMSADGAPTIVLAVSGDVQERAIYQTAQKFKRQIEAMPNVLEVDMNGHREEVIEILVLPEKLEYYGVTSNELIAAVQNNNLLVPAGQLDLGRGRFAVKVPSLIETREDIYRLPIRANERATLTLGELATVNRTFKDPVRISSINGKRAITLNVKKRADANDIEVTRSVRELSESMNSQIPKGVNIDFLMDQSDFSISMISEMQGNILTAMALVMVIVVAALGFRSGILVGAGVPFSLLFSAIILNQLGYSFNFMVLFGMLLALGMLIDGAIVITEFADRKMSEGMSSHSAYALSVKRMFWPVSASTFTTLAAFLPIMFWPGVAGEFMRYLPVTVFSVLIGSLLYALFFAPVIGSLMGKSEKPHPVQVEVGEESQLGTSSGFYPRFLSVVIHHPFLFLLGAIVILVLIFKVYGRFNSGVEFFVKTEQVLGEVAVRAQGNLSVSEANRLVSDIEQKVLKVPGVKVVYSIVSPGSPQQFGPRQPEEDQIATMLVETFKPEELGYSTFKIYDDIREVTKNTAGVIVTAGAMEGGPPIGKPIQIQLTSLDRGQLYAVTRKLTKQLPKIVNGLQDVTDTTPLPGIEWIMNVDKERAAQAGANVREVGNAIQLVTAGVKIGDYRPDDSEEEIDIRVRYPELYRGLQIIDQLKVNTPHGAVPLEGFVERVASRKIDKIERVNGKEYTMILADVKPGVVADQKVKEIKDWLAANPQSNEVEITFRGANEEQAKSLAFLAVAFGLALFLMFILLVTQFNSIYQAVLTLSSVVMSTAGVLLGLVLTQSMFSVIMTGVGIVALAGIVVNNNIVLIDTFNYLRHTNKDWDAKTAAIQAATQRLRPVILTTVTTILGLLPLATGWSIDLVNRTFILGGVVGSFWVSLASAIVYGLIFSTILTLAVTPTMLVLPSELKEKFKSRFGKG